MFGHAVPSKRVDEDGFSVSCMVEGIKWLGYSKLIPKNDNAPAIFKFLTEPLRELRIEGVAELPEEHPPKYDP